LRDCNSLGALCQHIESESCGVLRFLRVVQATMDSLLGQTNFKLILRFLDIPFVPQHLFASAARFLQDHLECGSPNTFLF